ncbi:MAG: acetate and sugar kinases/Hsc70/actin family protein [Pirellulales bacterium]
MPQSTNTLIAVDIGNSRIKLGCFDRTQRSRELPEPTDTLKLPLVSTAGDFDAETLAAWCREHATEGTYWLLSSVHRGATERLVSAVAALGEQLGRAWPLRQIAFEDVPLVVEVDSPERVGMDRLMGAVAADRLRPADRAAIVVDLGTATKLCLLTDVGAFVGGAILPGLAMSARALEEQTDALPGVDVERWQRPPQPLGKSTVPAIESGIFWGTVGAVRELVGQLSKSLASPPAVFITGGGSPLVAKVLAEDASLNLRHVPHLVLAGVAIVDAAGN